MNKSMLLGAALLVAAVQPIYAADAEGLALARANACMGCHKVDGRMVGPPFLEIGKRYAGAAEAQGDGTTQYLANAIQQGGRGRWGAIPMPAQLQVDSREAVRLAQWILSLPSE